MDACRWARRIIEAREVSPLAPAEIGPLAAHVARCGACARLARAESRLTRELAALRTEAPFEIDVTAVVRQRIAALGAIERDEVPTSQLGWAAAAAVACAAALVAAMWDSWPELARLAGDTARVSRELGRVFLALAGTLDELLLVPARLALRAASAALGATPAWSNLQPAAMTAAALGYAAMSATIALLVGRDLKRSPHRAGGDSR